MNRALAERVCCRKNTTNMFIVSHTVLPATQKFQGRVYVMHRVPDRSR